MIFWRKKNNQTEQEQEEREDKIIHPPKAPALEPSTDYEAEVPNDFIKQELHEKETQIIDEIDEIPEPDHGPSSIKEKDDNGGGWLSRLSEGLAKSTGKIAGGIGDIFSKKKIDEEALAELEDLLILADMGPKTASRLVDVLRQKKFDKDVTLEQVKITLADEITRILEQCVKPLNVKAADTGPRVYLVCGVNGVGKTTTIGKLAYQLHYKQNKKVVMAAGDTFRAAAIEQLQIWADRTKCPLIAKEIGADSASVAFEAYEKAASQQADILLIDTAGRLQNKAHLMAELEKMVRVLKKKDDTIPHEVLLILDATTGQNAISQVETFKQLVQVTGLIVTKLDGSAKGGVVVALADKFALPIYAIGVGETIEDLQAFKPEAFAKALVGLA